MRHELDRILSFEIVAPLTLKIRFSDDSVQTINFEPILHGEIYGPLRDLKLFNEVRVDEEVHTLIWPNGADFDPETLHDWPKYRKAWLEKSPYWGPLLTDEQRADLDRRLAEYEANPENVFSWEEVKSRLRIDQ